MKRVSLAILVVSLLAACGGETEPATTAGNTEASDKPSITLTTDQQETFARTCGLCHGVSGTGAPAAQDEEAWADRNTQGMEALLDHTVNGFGGMPPMGMCMECSQEDFAVFIQYMSGLECEE